MGNLKWEDLTPKERWKYVNQDFVRKYELLPRGTIGDITDTTLCGVDFDDPVRLKEIILELYMDGKREDEIAYHVPCSLQYIYRIVAEYKNKPYVLRERILELYRQGLTKKQIRLRLGCNRQYVYKVIEEKHLSQLES